ncbi:hypothetical protein ACFL0Y_01890 [Patescibacteria group bacterium]
MFRSKTVNTQPKESTKKREKFTNNLTTFFGLSSTTGFIVSFFILESLRPTMIRFQPLALNQKSSINFFGITLVTFLTFCLMVFYHLVKHFKNAKKISLFYLSLLLINVLSLLFIFSDLALISDIGKQYEHRLAQPEWLVLYLVMTGQLISALILTWANHFRLGKQKQLGQIAKDSNIFIIAQYVGVICGLMGLAFTSLNFLFPRPLWMIKLHVSMTAVFLLAPYLLIVGCWFMIKIKEKPKGWYDEKQIQDIGHSSLLTVALSVAVMGLIYFLNFNQPEGILSVIWFPFYLFLVLLLFSLGNLYFSQKH